MMRPLKEQIRELKKITVNMRRHIREPRYFLQNNNIVNIVLWERRRERELGTPDMRIERNADTLTNG